MSSMNFFFFFFLIYGAVLTCVVGLKLMRNVEQFTEDLLFLGTICWPLLFWSIWLNRNKVVFKNLHVNHEFAREIKHLATKYSFCSARSRIRNNKQLVRAKWSKFEKRWCKLNIDGFCLGNPRLATGDRLIQDQRGLWISGSTQSIVAVTNVDVELWTSREGLKLRLELNFPSVEVEINANGGVDHLIGLVILLATIYTMHHLSRTTGTPRKDISGEDHETQFSWDKTVLCKCACKKRIIYPVRSCYI